MKDVNKKIKA